MLTLNGSEVTHFQSCPRRWLLDQKWQVLRWRAKALFDACLREGIFSLSAGAAPDETIQAAQTRYLSTAANPGLDLTEGADPWVVANDYCASLATILTALSRLTLLAVTQAPRVEISPQLSWLPLSWADESGLLHRWIAVDRFDNATLAREAHSWQVFGDIVACGAPLTLHIIDIGRMRDGRRASPWCRAWKHPVIAHRYKFLKKNGRGNPTALGGQWKPIYYADQPNPDPAVWVDLMDVDQVTPTLLHHISIAQPSSEVCRSTLDQISWVAGRMSQLIQAHAGVDTRPLANESAMGEPMVRGACDGIVPCAWQEACYRERPADGIAELGLYQIRKASGEDERSSRPQQGQIAIA